MLLFFGRGGFSSFVRSFFFSFLVFVRAGIPVCLTYNTYVAEKRKHPTAHTAHRLHPSAFGFSGKVFFFSFAAVDLVVFFSLVLLFVVFDVASTRKEEEAAGLDVG